MKVMKKLIIFFAVLFYSLNAFATLTVSSRMYSGSTETVRYTNGTSATFNSTSAPVTWASDHITKTITYTFADGTKNPVVSTVQPTVGKTYNVGVETVLTTYGDGTRATVVNNSTSAPVTWASDHITKTITYTFADGTKNPVVSTQLPSQSGGSYSASIYPSNWTSTGVVVTKPVTSAINFTYGDGFVNTQSGTVSSPFDENLLAAKTITDPNAVIKTPTNITYNLTWGTPDKNGPSYANLFANGLASSYTFQNTFVIWGKTFSGQCLLGPYVGYCSNGPTVATPHPEVIAAWQQGWTGLGVNVLMEDFFRATDVHGVVTTIILDRYAPAAKVYGFNVPTQLGVYNENGTAASPTTLVKIGVINESWGANLPGIIGHSGPWTNAELAYAATSFAPSAQADINRITGVTKFNNFDLTTAVVVKAAGNDGASGVYANQEPLVKALANIPSINTRLLVVGALNYAGSTITPASIMSYSNKAGTDLSIQSRYLVASGTTPFTEGSIAVNGVPVSATTSFDPNGQHLGNVGTSYAAPRVAGYVAIVEQKFPNLTPVSTASILLQTARYDTLTCYPNCDPAIYGAGEASLSRALAPVGHLR